MNINKELKEYIEKDVFPEYDKNEVGHGIEHIKYRKTAALPKKSNASSHAFLARPT